MRHLHCGGRMMRQARLSSLRIVEPLFLPVGFGDDARLVDIQVGAQTPANAILVAHDHEPAFPSRVPRDALVAALVRAKQLATFGVALACDPALLLTRELRLMRLDGLRPALTPSLERLGDLIRMRESEVRRRDARIKNILEAAK